MLIGVTGISLAYAQLSLHWDIWKWSFFILAVISGAIIVWTLDLLIACSAFWTGRSRGTFIMVAPFYGLVHQYPVDIFGNAFRIIVTSLIPVAFMNYYPSLFLLDKLDRAGSAWWLSYMSPAVALTLLILSSAIWHLALRRYSSAGG
jgi:ABC-2 type transport system permease protein